MLNSCCSSGFFGFDDDDFDCDVFKFERLFVWSFLSKVKNISTDLPGHPKTATESRNHLS